MILDQRVLHQLTDISTKVNDFRTGSYTFPYMTGEYLYIASILPFNNMWIEVGTPNAVAATITVEMWYGQQWVPAVDLIDETVGLTASGRLQWNTDIDKGWDREERSKNVLGLNGTVIYDMYWVRLSWSANLTAGMTLKYLGQNFSNDDILYSFYPDLAIADLKTAFETGKTTWTEQHYMAAEHIIRDLKKRDIIKSRAQILDYAKFVDASCHKVAEIVYQAFGTPYLEQLKLARSAYNEALNVKFYNVDKDANGRLDRVERKFTTDFMTR